MNAPDQPTVALVSLGCPKNLVDSERMLAALALGGFIVTDSPDGADVVVVNTCAFIDVARAETDACIDELEALKRAGRLKRIVVAGCMAQRYGAEVLERHPKVDAVAGLAERDDLAAVARAALGRRGRERPLVRVGPHPPTAPDDRERLRLTPRHYAYLRISEGCDNRCAYCAIPDIRGPLRSKPPEAVLAEAQELVADGAKELILIGQDTTAYGRDLSGGWTPARLLALLRDRAGAEWIRLMYTHPASFSEEVIEELARGLPVAPYVDLPLQHVNSAILESMGRGVARPEIERLIGRLREAVPDLAIRTTFIVGYPRETEEAFEELVSFARKVRFDHVGVFLYSPEAGTRAAELPYQTPLSVRRTRWDRLMRVCERLAHDAAARDVGRTMRVRVDGRAPMPGRLAARHAGLAPEVDPVVLLPEGVAAVGEMVTVRIVAAEGYDTVGEVVEAPSEAQG